MDVRSSAVVLMSLGLSCGCHATGSGKPVAAGTRPAPVVTSAAPTATVPPDKATRAPAPSRRALTAGGLQTVAHEPQRELERHESEVSVGTEPAPLGSAFSLSDCLSLSLAQNPDLLAIRANEPVASATLGVAETYPFNPSIQVQATPYQDAQQGGPGSTYHYVLLMQTLQLAHQQQFREESAAFSLNSVRWNIHQAELLNVAQTERLYWTALYQDGLLRLAAASDANNQQLLQTLEKQLRAGQATAADVAIVRVDANSTRQQLRLAGANRENAIRDLRRHLGLPQNAQLSLTDDLRSYHWRLPADRGSASPMDSAIDTGTDARDVALSWAASRPDVMAARSDVDIAGANLGLATANRTPDLQLGPYYQRTMDGTTFVGFRGQVDIPVVNSGKPLEQQRVAERRQRLEVWQQAQRRAGLDAEAAFERYEMALAAVKEGGSADAVGLPNELESLEKQFVAGEVDVVRVIQARTSIIQNRRVQLDLLNELAQSAANLTAATGLPAEQLMQAKSPNP